MILPDTSAWVEYFRATGSTVHLQVRALLGSKFEHVATTSLVVMELAAGIRTSSELRGVQRMTVSCRLLRTGDPDDYLNAATIYRACRRGGETIRTMIDCVIAAVAIREHAEVLHHDRDFDAIARHTPLQLA